jgi:hypothetical protein
MKNQGTAAFGIEMQTGMNGFYICLQSFYSFITILPPFEYMIG